MQSLLGRARTNERRAAIEAELTMPKFPAALAYLWVAFDRLSSRRGSTGFGPAPISWPEIDAFARLSGIRLAPWEVEILEALDRLAMEAVVKPAS